MSRRGKEGREIDFVVPHGSGGGIEDSPQILTIAKSLANLAKYGDDGSEGEKQPLVAIAQGGGW